jgi:rhodanese-related sulfurtransferase
VDHPGQVAILDVRPVELFDSYHLPGARSVPGASSAEVRSQAGDLQFVLLVAETDAKATELVAANGPPAGPQVHFLKGGAADYYLNVELPAPLFSSKPPPHGHGAALRTVRAWLASPSAVPVEQVREALGTLASLAFVPDQLGAKKKAAPGGAKKKIAGGCG